MKYIMRYLTYLAIRNSGISLALKYCCPASAGQCVYECGLGAGSISLMVQYVPNLKHFTSVLVDVTVFSHQNVPG